MKKNFIIFFLIIITIPIIKLPFFPSSQPHLMPLRPELLEELKAKKSLLYFDKTFIVSPVKQPSLKKMELVGQKNALFLLVDFADNVATFPSSYFQELLLSKGIYPTGSLRDYYNEVSYGLVDITGEISGKGGPTFGWYRAPNTYSYYVNGQQGLGPYPQNTQKLVADIVDLADPYVDFSLYDNDNDGVVDFLFIIHAGQGYEYTGNKNDIWSHQWETKNPIIKDKKKINYYCIQPEKLNQTTGITIGVFCHESGHLLGLPDLYDTDKIDEKYESQGLGYWSIMASGGWLGNPQGSKPAHFDVWCKIQLGIIKPIIPSGIASISLPPVENEKVIYKLWKENKPQKEYFLIENRQKIGFDANLPAGGLLIYHVDDNQPNNNDQTHYKVALEQADGLFQLEKKVSEGGNYGDSGDVWSGNSKFWYNSTPNSRDYNGNDTLVKLLNIRRDNLNILLDLSVVLIKEVFLFNKTELYQSYPNPLNPECWIPYTIEGKGLKDVKIKIYNVLGQVIRQINLGNKVKGEYLTKDKAAYWDGKDNYGKKVSSGIYFYELIINGEVIGIKKNFVLK